MRWTRLCARSFPRPASRVPTTQATASAARHRSLPGLFHDETELAVGMTLALEPGCYGGGFGVRLEHLVLVSEDGCEPLTTHSIELT